MTKANQALAVVTLPPVASASPETKPETNGGDSVGTKKTTSAEIQAAKNERKEADASRKEAEETSRKARAFLSRTDHLFDLYATNGAFEALIDKLVAAEDKEAEALQAEVDALKDKLAKHGQLHLLGISEAPKAKRGRKPGSTNKGSSAKVLPASAVTDDDVMKVESWIKANPNKKSKAISEGTEIAQDVVKGAIARLKAAGKLKPQGPGEGYTLKKG